MWLRIWRKIIIEKNREKKNIYRANLCQTSSTITKKKKHIETSCDRKKSIKFMLRGSGEFTLACFAVTKCAAHLIAGSQYVIVANSFFFVFQFHQPTNRQKNVSFGGTASFESSFFIACCELFVCVCSRCIFAQLLIIIMKRQSVKRNITNADDIVHGPTLEESS